MPSQFIGVLRSVWPDRILGSDRSRQKFERTRKADAGKRGPAQFTVPPLNGFRKGGLSSAFHGVIRGRPGFPAFPAQRLGMQIRPGEPRSSPAVGRPSSNPYAGEAQEPFEAPRGTASGWINLLSRAHSGAEGQGSKGRSLAASEPGTAHDQFWSYTAMAVAGYGWG
jgi:hypothetical protein